LIRGTVGTLYFWRGGGKAGEGDGDNRGVVRGARRLWQIQMNLEKKGSHRVI